MALGAEGLGPFAQRAQTEPLSHQEVHLRDIGERLFGGARDGVDIVRRRQPVQRCDMVGKLGRHTLGGVGAGLPRDIPGDLVGPKVLEIFPQGVDRRLQALDGRRHVHGDGAMTQHPQHAAHHHALHFPQHHQLHIRGHFIVQRLDAVPQLPQTVGGAGDGVGPGYIHRSHPCPLHQRVDERRPDAIDETVGDDGRDDLAAQLVFLDRARELLLQGDREVVVKVLLDQGIVRQVAADDFVVQPHLAIAEEHREFGAHETQSRRQAFLEFFVVRQEFDIAVEKAVALEQLHGALLRLQQRRRAVLHHADGLALLIIVAQHQLGHFIGHFRQEFVARLQRDLAFAHLAVQQDLDVHLVVGTVDAGRIIDGVGVETHALFCRFDAPALGHAQVGAFTHDLGADLVAVDAVRVVGAVRGVGIAFAGRLHIGPDAAEEHQVDLGAQDRIQDFGRRGLGLIDLQQGLHLRRQLDRLGAALEHAAALADQFRVIVRPVGARQFEQALALGEALGRIRGRIDKDVQVIEGGLQFDVLGHQHAVAEYVAGHVADADAGEVLGLGIDTDLAEVALHALPCAAGGNAHGLMVVARAAARGIGVAQPEAVFRRHAVGDVREGRRAFIGRNHEIRIVRVAPHHLVRVHDLVVHHIVGDVEQAALQGFVALDPLGQERIAPAGGRRLLHHEAALRARRHDHGVLHHLRFHQPQDFRAEILATVGPTDAAARHLSAAQVNRFHPRRIHEHFHVHARQRQFLDALAVQLHRHVPLRLSIRERLEKIGAQGAVHEIEVAAQDTVFVGIGDAVQGRVDVLADALNLRGSCLHFRRRVERRVEGGEEQIHQQAPEFRMGGEGVFDIGLAEGESGLAQVLRISAQDRHFTPGEVR